MSVQIPNVSPIIAIDEPFPGTLQLGDINEHVLTLKNELNVISVNYPDIPRIYSVNQEFDESTETAVRNFQRIFQLPVTGVVDKATWFEIKRIYEAVRRLAASSSEVIIPIEIYQENIPEPGANEIFPTIQLAQYFLNVLSVYYDAIPAVDINGTLDNETQYSIRQFQRIMGLPATGFLDDETWNLMYSYILGILETLPSTAISLPALLYPGVVLTEGSEGANVFIMQLFLSYITSIILSIPPVNTNGLFDAQMTTAVTEFQRLNGIEPTGMINEETWSRIVDVYRQMRFSSYRPIGQYPGTLIGE
ncbi:peptidoglycan-binding domain-containing protein [Sedimentibacter sp.]|uniref:peptidoglycan-binding domain-containing protein n=1 Tax=Sedimentibacter sp. TaxID=1960295 RepID=UPI0028A9E7B6|nr:peptidoglycan-binding domain-containing protein [Sedimentibacter sp.]